MSPDDNVRFAAEREELDRLVMRYAGPTLKRFYNLDARAYEDGALSAKVKEFMGLAASLVLRCDDCVTYHLGRLAAAGVTDAEVAEALAVGVVVGGSVTIPHLRRAFRTWEGLRGPAATAGARPGE